MSVDERLARPLALFGVLLNSASFPLLSVVDSKQQLFSRAVRLGLNELMTVLCPRLQLEPMVMKRNEQNRVTAAFAAHLGLAVPSDKTMHISPNDQDMPETVAQ